MANSGQKGPADIAKEAGLKSLAEMAEISTVRVRTLHDWFIDDRPKFDCMLAGAVALKAAAQAEA